jgi:hypothetical protein
MHWAPFVILEGTEATELSSKSTGSNFVTKMPLKIFKLFTCVRCPEKPRFKKKTPTKGKVLPFSTAFK